MRQGSGVAASGAELTVKEPSVNQRAQLHARVARIGSWSEHEIRAHPRLYAAFYTALSRYPWVRKVAGLVRDRVRDDAGVERPHTAGPPVVDELRLRAVASRLGLDRGAP